MGVYQQNIGVFIQTGYMDFLNRQGSFRSWLLETWISEMGQGNNVHLKTYLRLVAQIQVSYNLRLGEEKITFCFVAI